MKPGQYFHRLSSCVKSVARAGLTSKARENETATRADGENHGDRQAQWAFGM